jgi:hypothetical protein
LIFLPVTHKGSGPIWLTKTREWKATGEVYKSV